MCQFRSGCCRMTQAFVALLAGWQVCNVYSACRGGQGSTALPLQENEPHVMAIGKPGAQLTPADWVQVVVVAGIGSVLEWQVQAEPLTAAAALLGPTPVCTSCLSMSCCWLDEPTCIEVQWHCSPRVHNLPLHRLAPLLHANPPCLSGCLPQTPTPTLLCSAGSTSSATHS